MTVDLIVRLRSESFVAVVYPPDPDTGHRNVAVLARVAGKRDEGADSAWTPVGFAALDVRGRWHDMSKVTETRWPPRLEAEACKVAKAWHARSRKT